MEALEREFNWHALKTSDVFRALFSGRKGLSEAEVLKRREKYGFNELVEGERITPLKIFFFQLKNVMTLMLAIAALISFLIGESLDAYVILAILVINVILGFFQEYKAEKSMEALKSLAAPKAVVIRDGAEKVVWSRELVPGDIVLLSVGDIVPANLRLFDVVNLKVDQSHLTGESIPIFKRDEVLDEKTPLADRANIAFMGSVVSYGKALGIVTAIGMMTEIGQIAKTVTTEKEERTPLEREINNLAKWLAVASVVSVMFVFFFGLLYNYDFVEMLLTSVSLAVSAVPEGLPAVITITLAIGMRRMASNNAVVRKLNSVQTLGNVTVICSDKTGTITKNEMTVKKIFDGFNEYDVSGSGYSPEGDFLLNNKKILVPDNLKKLLISGSLCNNAYYGKSDGSYGVVGDPTEGCLLVVAAKAGIWYEELKKDNKEIAEISFTSDRKRMSVVYACGEESCVYSKGAPDVMLGLCSRIQHNGRIIKLTKAMKDKLLQVNSNMAQSALRVLAIAYKPNYKGPLDEKLVEKDLVFLGLVGMIDPARPEVKSAIELTRKAGIRVVIITGDHKLTAMAVARDIGLFTNESVALSGDEIDKMTDDEFKHAVSTATIFARVSPDHKFRIVEALKSMGEIIAVTGDGVNDAPALKSAHIGVAMGIKGTDVSKEASDMVLTDDNFSTIVSAVEQGRGIFNNIKKFVKFLLSSNVDTIFVVLFSIFAGLPLPYLPLHILWMNLITDGFPALALSVDNNNKDIMSKPPRNPKKSLMREVALFTIIGGFVGAIASIILFVSSLSYSGFFVNFNDYDLLKARTMGISSAIIFELFFVFNCRDDDKSLWERSFRDNFLSNKGLLIAVIVSLALQLMFIYLPPLQVLFKTAPLSITELGFVFFFASWGLFILPKWFHKDLTIGLKD